jgi:hypothetical protein
MVATSLFATKQYWEPLRRAHDWMARASTVLANEEQADAATVEERYRAVLEEVMTDKEDQEVGAWAVHFYTVSRSYWRGLFHCYDVPEVPRTNNELEQYCGKARHHERRATGHKSPPSGVTVRGSVRVVAAVATPLGVWTADTLRPRCVAAWRAQRENLEGRHEARRAAQRFRRDPAAYLARLEAQLLQ